MSQGAPRRRGPRRHSGPRLRRRILLVAGPLLVLTLAVASVSRLVTGPRGQREPATSTRNTRPDERSAIGVNAHPLHSDDHAWPQLSKRLGSAGLRWVRIDVDWNFFQPDGPRVAPDAAAQIHDAIATARRADLEVIVTFVSTPDWANGDRGIKVPPGDPRTYADAIGALAAQERGHIAAYEIWNEPNLVDAWAENPAAYVPLLRGAAAAVRRNDPKALVVLGGLSTNDDRWLSAIYDAGAKDFFDVVAVHPYPYPSDEGPDAPDTGESQFSHLPAIRAVMERNHDTRPVWITELGWSTHDDPSSGRADQRGVSEAKQAANLRTAVYLLRARFPFVTAFIWYEARDEEGLGAHENNFGLLRRDLSPKPAFSAIVALAARRGPGP